MLLIECPHCGPRAEIEFRCGGEAHIARPADPMALTDDQLAEFLFYRTSPKGIHAERWNHAHGCQRWFNAHPRHGERPHHGRPIRSEPSRAGNSKSAGSVGWVSATFGA